MKVTIGIIEITTEHPASRYGAGVALVSGSDKGYCPDDLIRSRLPIGPAHFKCADMIASGVHGNSTNWQTYTEEEIDFINKFLSQSPEPIGLDYDRLVQAWADNSRKADEAEKV